MGMLNVVFLTAQKVLFEGEAFKVILPGENGIFEIAPFHKTLVSRLLPGTALIDSKEFPIRHGLAKVNHNRVVVMAELDETIP